MVHSIAMALPMHEWPLGKLAQILVLRLGIIDYAPVARLNNSPISKRKVTFLDKASDLDVRKLVRRAIVKPHWVELERIFPELGVAVRPINVAHDLGLGRDDIATKLAGLSGGSRGNLWLFNNKRRLFSFVTKCVTVKQQKLTLVDGV